MSAHRSIPAGIQQWFGEAGKWDRAIVAKRVGILAGLPVALNLLAVILHSAGVSIPDGLPDRITLIVIGGLNAAALLGGTLWAQHGVTPADPALKPMAANGEALVTVSAAVAAAGRPASSSPAQAILAGGVAAPVVATAQPDLAAAALAAANAIHPA
jgi:hypothetical protein